MTLACVRPASNPLACVFATGDRFGEFELEWLRGRGRCFTLPEQLRDHFVPPPAAISSR